MNEFMAVSIKHGLRTTDSLRSMAVLSSGGAGAA